MTIIIDDVFKFDLVVKVKFAKKAIEYLQEIDIYGSRTIE